MWLQQSWEWKTGSKWGWSSNGITYVGGYEDIGFSQWDREPLNVKAED